MTIVDRWTELHGARADEYRLDLNHMTMTGMIESGDDALLSQNQLLFRIRRARARLQQTEQDLENAILYMRQSREDMI